jgi:hypothetical protein
MLVPVSLRINFASKTGADPVDFGARTVRNWTSVIADLKNGAKKPDEQGHEQSDEQKWWGLQGLNL